MAECDAVLTPAWPCVAIRLQAIIDEKIPVIETAGSPLCAKYWEMFKRANKDVTIIHKCVSIRHALKAQDGGCDFISLDGFECAGHPGVCLPQVPPGPNS
jgi:nitronate monooxygenase